MARCRWFSTTRCKMAYEITNSPWTVRVPWPVRRGGVGLGTAFKERVTAPLGIKQCEPCKQRERRLNALLRFVRK